MMQGSRTYCTCAHFIIVPCRLWTPHLWSFTSPAHTPFIQSFALTALKHFTTSSLGHTPFLEAYAPVLLGFCVTVTGHCNQQLCAAVSDSLAVCKLEFGEKEMSSFRERKSAYLHPVPGLWSTNEAPITAFLDRVLMSLLCNMKANICFLNIDL